MDEILKQIHYYAQQLKGINMWQAAGDYDYISSFLDSPRWNDGEYYGVVPRGEETVDEYSHNCPIPFTANKCLVSRCYDNDKALEILNKLSEIFSTLKSDVSGDGLTAINAYIENTNLYIELLGGEPTPPGPEPPVYNTYYAGGIISSDTSIDFVVTKPDKTFFTVDNISLYSTSSNIGGVYTADNISLYSIQSSTGGIYTVDNITTYNAPIIMPGVMEKYEPPQPTDRILLYFLSGTTVKRQGYVTKTSSPNSNYVYSMYTSETVQDNTTLFVPEQDKIYKAGSIVDGDIKSYSERVPTRYVDKLSDMPSSATSDGNADVALYEFVDNGLWLASNFIYETEMQGMTRQWFKIEDIPAPALPTVSYIGQLCVANRAQLAMNANEVAALRKWDVNESIPYNTSYKYSTSKYSSGGSQKYSAVDNFRIQATSQGGSYILAVKNISGSAKVFYYIYVYSCDSPDATVITVYDSSNNPYNAFQYTSDGTDYYYVLDGTQTDWTDDLSGIGYHVLSVAYLDIQDKFVNWNVWVWLFENNSASRYVDFDSNKRYIFDSAYTLNGSKVNLTSHTITIGRPNSTTEILGLIDSYSGFTAYKVYYHAIPNS